MGQPGGISQVTEVLGRHRVDIGWTCVDIEWAWGGYGAAVCRHGVGMCNRVVLESLVHGSSVS